MRSTSITARRGTLARVFTALVAGLPLLFLPGCDSPACVFGGNCSGTGGGGIGANPATIPTDGTWIDSAAPRVTNLFPTGTTVDTKSPVVVVFSESMAPTNLNVAFELVAEGAASGAVPFGVNALVAEGRVLVLVPLTPLLLNTNYTVRYRQNVNFQDLTGQVIVQPADRVVGTFSTGAADATAPSLLFSWPTDTSTDQSATGEIVTVFSRPMDAASVVDASFVVTVNSAAPTFDPVATPLTVNNGLTTDTRVFRYRSVDNSGVPQAFANSAQVRVSLSPTGTTIRDTSSPPVVLPPTIVNYRVAAFGPPSAAAITSNPTDAVGIDQLSGPANLAVLLTTPDGASGDQVLVTLFGTKLQTDPNPPLIALDRAIALEAPFTTFTLTAADLNIASSTAPLVARFADGALGVAVQMKRGTKLSPVRMLDVDLATSGVQSPVLDTVAPTLTGLGTSGTVVASYRSDLRDLVIAGRASETLRSVLVETPSSGDNDVDGDGFPPVAGAHRSGLFVAGPVNVGLVATTVPYTVTIFDRALNSGGSVTGSFRQLGAVGPGATPLGTDIAVEVFDAVTLSPISGATVFAHEDVGGTITSLESSLTDVAGNALVTSSVFGDTLITVFASGYDLITVEGVLSDRLSLPLRPIGLANAGTDGLVATTQTTFNLFTKSLADSRAPTGSDRLANVAACSFDNTQSRFECPFGPTTILARETGAQSAFGVQVPANLFLYSALTFLHGFELALPVPPVNPGATQTNEITVPALLSDPSTSAEERAIDGPPLVLSTANYPTQSGGPRVTIEGRGAGVHGTVVVGQGVAFDLAPPSTNWGVRAAYPGAVDGIQDVPTDQLGRYVKSRAVEADLMVGVELVDPDGNRGASRPRLSTNPIAVTPPASALLDATTPIALNAGNEALDLQFGDVLADALSEPGLYRVTVTDAAGRNWTVYHADIDDASGPSVVVHLPLVGTGTTLPLAAGDLDVRVTAYAWPTLDYANLLWTDLEREFELRSISKAQTVTPP
ncbi:MAG: Ig-like domain-containing protein [Planctomycetes bacterium]|nr:Ig-like domain-containing protein [Planctomycetota bacterium]